MKKYLLGSTVIALAVCTTSFAQTVETNLSEAKKVSSINKDEAAPNACVWFQFIGSAGDWSSVQNKNNWLEYTSDPSSLCNNVNVKVCAICVKTSNVTGTAPNRTIVSMSNIYFNYTGPGGYYYAFMPGPSDLDAFRNRN